jgi:hypothetical protein
MLGALATAGAVGASAAPRTDPDAFVYHGVAIQWCDWRDPPNQNVSVGFWTAHVAPDAWGRDYLIATTMGHLGRYCEMSAIDLTLQRDWPLISARSTKTERAAVKARALAMLKADLDA